MNESLASRHSGINIGCVHCHGKHWLQAGTTNRDEKGGKLLRTNRRDL